MPDSAAPHPASFPITNTWGYLKKGKFMYAKARQRGFSGFGEV